MTSDRESYSSLSTSTISDACDRLGFAAGCLGIRPLEHSMRMVGRAFTVRYVPIGHLRGNVGDYLDEVSPGSVVVIDNRGRTDCTVWGDILTAAAHQRGIGGTLIDGVCRDVPGILDIGYPVFSRGAFMMTGKDRVMVESTQEVVSIGDRQVRPGDLIIGDGSGVVVIPWERVDDVREVAEVIDAAERAIVSAVARGDSLGSARSQHGYHELQSVHPHAED